MSVLKLLTMHNVVFFLISCTASVPKCTGKREYCTYENTYHEFAIFN